jgi:hypothetical protein
MDTFEIAEVCHEVNRAYCQAIGDNSQPPWKDAPEWQKGSAVRGVEFHIDSPNAGPEGSHNNWMKEKEAAGWTWGPVKDPEKKEHPQLAPYSRLPAEQKAKDYIFTAIVHALKDK